MAWIMAAAVLIALTAAHLWFSTQTLQSRWHDFRPPIPRHPPCARCGPHEAHILPCECGCTATHPYGTWED